MSRKLGAKGGCGIIYVLRGCDEGFPPSALNGRGTFVFGVTKLKLIGAVVGGGRGVR